jgi:hypothetical protein
MAAGELDAELLIDALREAGAVERMWTLGAPDMDVQ